MLQCPPKEWIEANKRGEIPDPHVNPAIKRDEQTVFRPFLMQATAVTREMYRQFDPSFEISDRVAEKLTAYASPNQKIAGNLNDFPVIMVHWFDCWCFCKWLGSKYCLPESPQWEFACRGGTETEYCFGESLTHEMANFASEMGQTTPVGFKKYGANHFGLFDVHGNVWEWTATARSWVFSRNVCGGSWYKAADRCHCSFRFYFSSEDRHVGVGFRLCRVD